MIIGLFRRICSFSVVAILFFTILSAAATDQVFAAADPADNDMPEFYAEFETDEEPVLLESISTYHWSSDQESEPVNISLYDCDDNLIGSWLAEEHIDAGGKIITMDVFPNIILAPFEYYYVTDSDPETWLWSDRPDGGAMADISMTTDFDPAESFTEFTDEGDLELTAVVRDFKADGILFEGSISSRSGMTSNILGEDQTPQFDLSVWQEMYGSEVTSEDLYTLFHDVPGVNTATSKTLLMKQEPDQEGYWVIDSAVDQEGNSSDGLFLIDNELFGNEGRSHNYHFSLEFHTSFKYVENAMFEFNGDDDLWVFINGQLMIDLGGVHSRQSASISLKDHEAELGISPGDIIAFDLFYMERHTTESNMMIRTNFEFMNGSKGISADPSKKGSSGSVNETTGTVTSEDAWNDQQVSQCWVLTEIEHNVEGYEDDDPRFWEYDFEQLSGKGLYMIDYTWNYHDEYSHYTAFAECSDPPAVIRPESKFTMDFHTWAENIVGDPGVWGILEMGYIEYNKNPEHYAYTTGFSPMNEGDPLNYNCGDGEFSWKLWASFPSGEPGETIRITCQFHRGNKHPVITTWTYSWKD